MRRIKHEESRLAGLEEELHHHEQSWKMKKKSSFFFLGFIVFAVLLLGQSRNIGQTAPKLPGISVQYNHVLQQHAEMEVMFRCNGSRGVEYIAIPHSYMKNFRLGKIIPEPEERVISRGRILFRFNKDINREVIIYLTPNSTGAVEASWRVNEGSLRFSHFIYP